MNDTVVTDLQLADALEGRFRYSERDVTICGSPVNFYALGYLVKHGCWAALRNYMEHCYALPLQAALGARP